MGDCRSLTTFPDWSSVGSASYFFIIIVIRHETTAAARWALPLIVCTLFNDAIAVALWTGFGFHVCLPVDSFASLTRRPEEKLQSQSYSHSVRRSVLAPLSVFRRQLCCSGV